MRLFKYCVIVVVLTFTRCGIGYDRVRYTEMTNPPTVTIKENELIVTTRNTEGEGLSVYKVDIEIRDRVKVIELRGYKAIGKPEKTEFKVPLSKSQLEQIQNYKVYWLNPGGKKNRVQLIINK